MFEIKIMAEYQCFPLWDVGMTGPDNINPETLPISAALAKDFQRWADRYDLTLDQTYPPDSRFESAEAHSRFVTDGRLLARRLKDEMGNAVKVSYVNDLSRELELVTGF